MQSNIGKASHTSAVVSNSSHGFEIMSISCLVCSGHSSPQKMLSVVAFKNANLTCREKVEEGRS